MLQFTPRYIIETVQHTRSSNNEIRCTFAAPVEVSDCTKSEFHVRIHEKTPTRYERGRLVVSIPSFGLVYKSCGTKMAAPFPEISS